MGRGWSDRIFDVRREEAVPVVLAGAFFFLLLFCYFMLRPLRETMGLRGGVDELRWLFIGTVLVMVGANVVYGFIAARLPRGVLVPAVYGLAIVSLLIFFLLLKTTPEAERDPVGKAFFVWLSVFNLFAVSVFWQLMADLFTLEQGKRLFGLIGVGGTAGAITGSSYAWTLARTLGPDGLIGSAIVILVLASGLSVALCRRASRRAGGARRVSPNAGAALGGTAWAGLVSLFRSRYLSGIGLMVTLFAVVSTLLYFEKMRIVGASVEGDDARTSLFAAIELGGQSLTIVLQVLLTGRLMRWVGVGVMLAVVPVVSVIGFGVLGLMPTLAVIAVFEATRRAANYAMTKPARETLFTVVPREDKYKAKAGIDTFLYRGGDTLGAATDRGLALLGLPLATVAIPLGIVGACLAWWLGREEKRLSLGGGQGERGTRPATLRKDAL